MHNAHYIRALQTSLILQYEACCQQLLVTDHVQYMPGFG